MEKLTLKMIAIRELLKDEEGQDLIEYALLIALVAFGAVAGMSGLAGSINSAFGTVGTRLTGYMS